MRQLSVASGARPARRSTRWRQVAQSRQRPGPGTALPRVLLALLVFVPALGLGLFAAGTAAAVAAYQSVVRDLPSVATLPERPIFKTTQILDRHGNVLFEVFDQEAGRRTVVPLADVPTHLINATIATEDADFFNNPGVDPRGIVRAALANLEMGRVVAGGSTISQQLVKNVLIPPEERHEATLSRKVREAILAFQLSRTYSKEQILAMYLNEILYGNLASGVEAAAHTYFGKSVHEVTLPEAAMLAGLPQAPASYDPFRNPAAAKERQGQVLDLMVRHGYVDAATAEDAKAAPLHYASPSTGEIVAPHFVMYVRDLLAERYGQRALFQAGLKVYTTLDPDTQLLAEEAVAKHVATLARQDARNAGLVALDPHSGEILAMVGSPDYFNAAIDGQVNAAIADRQPGSAIKPIVYLAALQRGFNPATVILDQPTRFPDGPNRFYAPENFDKRFRGAVTVRRALGNSLNIPAVKTLQFVGVREAVRLSRALGITSLSEDRHYGLSFTLGGTEVKLLELSGAYAALANGGRPVPVSPILRIEDSAGNVLEERQPAGEPVVDPRLTFMITDILADNDARRETFGVNSPLRLTRPAAVKTGSTDDYRDSWAVGYTPKLLAGVWVGNSDGRPMRFVLGSSGAGLIWKDFLERALEGEPGEPFAPPDGLVRGAVCAVTGYQAVPGCWPQVTDWFLAERPPRPASAPRPKVAINRQSNKLATAYCPLPTIEFRAFGGSPSGEGPYPPTEYCDLHGPQTGRPAAPWDTAPTATPLPTATLVQPTPVSSRVVLGPTPAPLPTWTPRPTLTPTPQPSPTPVPTATPLGLAGAPSIRVLPMRSTGASLAASNGSSAYHPWAGLPHEVELSFPSADQSVEGMVPVLGSASVPYFERYAVQYGEGETPTEWSFIGPSRTQPVRSGVLEIWDTSALPNGQYTLVLALADSRGETHFARQLVTLRRSAVP